MPANHQMKSAIEQAQTNLAVQGTEHADIKDVLLAGFGYISACFEDKWQNTTVIRLEGKRLLGIGLVIGGVIVTLVEHYV